ALRDRRAMFKRRIIIAGVVSIALGGACTSPTDVLESTTNRIGASGGHALSADGRLDILVAPGVVIGEGTITIRTDRHMHVIGQDGLAYEVIPDPNLQVAASLHMDRDGAKPFELAMLGTNASFLPLSGSTDQGGGVTVHEPSLFHGVFAA